MDLYRISTPDYHKLMAKTKYVWLEKYGSYSITNRVTGNLYGIEKGDGYIAMYIPSDDEKLKGLTNQMLEYKTSVVQGGLGFEFTYNGKEYFMQITKIEGTNTYKVYLTGIAKRLRIE